MAGIKDVAAAAGVSTATVSRALTPGGRVSATTRERVETAATRLGYVASSLGAGLATGRTRNIGVIVPLIDRWFYSQVVGGIAVTLQDLGYDLTLYNTALKAGQDERIFHDYLYRRQVDAVISVSMQLKEQDASFLRSVGRPAVGIGFSLEGLSTVGVDDYAMAHQATTHLTGLGHRDIAHVSGGRVVAENYSLIGQRQRGFADALAETGTGVNASWVVESDFTIADARAKISALLGSGRRPTAVFCDSDEMAIGGMLAASQLGLRVQEDVSFIGIDGHELGEAMGLTTISQAPGEQGRIAAQTLLRSLSPESTADDLRAGHQLVESSLVVRSSTRRL
ncbi:LacI family DNA-binding transcriptional regulator [Haematomicrobium sanguinis]|uniref:LacI family DNA-binding transcriptional regulator n=1 Tax=Haematomicrobium sanguinis TaxID=479106 RepID=UPI00047B3A48|nr:LacI family DNA-binding transcriptional regulator [Haematomicrobium sanguinis]